MRLRYAGACSSGVHIDKCERAGWDRAAKRVVCLTCVERSWEQDSSAASTPPSTPPDVGVAGAADRREYERRKPRTTLPAPSGARCGAPQLLLLPGRAADHPRLEGRCYGEERVAKALFACTEAGSGYALHDRRVPGKRSNIDHLFVGAAGIFVIDAKFYKDAEVSVERSGGLVRTPHRDPQGQGPQARRSHHCHARAARRRRRSNAGTEVEGPPVIPVLCFVDGLLPMREKNRRVDGVRLCRLKGLAQLVSADGDWDDAQRLEVARALSRHLPSMIGPSRG